MENLPGKWCNHSSYGSGLAKSAIVLTTLFRKEQRGIWVAGV
jgi:hypothetical protein